MAKKRFPGIKMEAFQAPTDKAALAALQAVPLFPIVVQTFHKYAIDRYLYCWNLANSVRCGPNQLPTLYNILTECCKILDVPEPELYITNNPVSNAFAGGVERPYITLQSAIVNNLSEEQLYHLIGHELGHIKAGHVLYKTVGAGLIYILQILGHATMGVGDVVGLGLSVAFMEWSRQAELTCDRAGLLCTQDFKQSAEAELLLTSGTTRYNNELNLDAFLDQARMYQDMKPSDEIGKILLYYFYGVGSTHPFPVLRAQELEKWYMSGDFQKIMDGKYAGATATV